LKQPIPFFLYEIKLTITGHLSAAVALKVASSNNPSALAAQILRIPLTCHPLLFPGVLLPKETVPIFNDSATLNMLSNWHIYLCIQLVPSLISL
jgi:hypothetical protein